MNNSPVMLPDETIETLMKLKFKELMAFDKVPSLDFEDTLLVVTSTNTTGRATVEQFMQYLNENLRNFICWKPVVTNSTLSWERSSNDEAPGEIHFDEIMFPMASESSSGMISPEFFIKLRDIKADDIVYKDALNEAIETRAPSTHVHDQYQLKSEMPKNVSAFENDKGYITEDDIPNSLSAFSNEETKFITLNDIPTVSLNENGLMTSQILQLINDINDDYVGQNQISDIVREISENLPTKISSFENDLGYVRSINLIDAIGEIGSVNMIANSDFRFTDSDGNIQNWVIANGTASQYLEDPDYPYVAKVVYQSGGIFSGNILLPLGSFQTISFYAKADVQTDIRIGLGSAAHVFSIGTVWTRYTVTMEYSAVDVSHKLLFSVASDDTPTLYLTQVQVERGRLATEYYPSYDDLDKRLTLPATSSRLGVTRPDNVTTSIDENGVISVIPNPSITGVQIDDESASGGTTYSSYNIEQKLMTKAPLVDGIIPSDYLPEYLDDVIEGTMILNEHGELFFIADEGQHGSEYPETGKIYLDTTSNLAYRWTGSTYMQCTTDKLGGAVLVKYDATDNFMYFVFPE